MSIKIEIEIIGDDIEDVQGQARELLKNLVRNPKQTKLDIDYEIGPKIRKIRRDLGKTQEDFGKLIDVHPVTLSRMENSVAPVSTQTLSSLFDYLSSIQYQHDL